MPVVRASYPAALLCFLVLAGCRSEPDDCPQSTVIADPQQIPTGTSETTLIVNVYEPLPDDGFAVVTELSAESGTVADPFARETTYACAFDITGPVEICVTTTYTSNGTDEAASNEAARVGAAQEYLRGPNVYLDSPLQCSTTQCIEVTCPQMKNSCPEVASFTIDPDVLSEGETATVTVAAEDPDDSPDPLVTTITARRGMIADPNASQTTYTCDPSFGGFVSICVDASDGECTETVCEGVRCPGEPTENTCPIVQSVSANPNPISSPNDTTTVTVAANDPDEFPEPLTLEWSSEGGGFEDPSAAETTFRCTEPGPVEVCVTARDGDQECDDDPSSMRCITVQCPGDIVPNFCPNLNVINATPSTIISPATSTSVETRGWDTDEKPFPLVLTLSAIWGSFENTENLQCEVMTPECPQSSNVVFQDATYQCDRPGPVELCVEATDGACTKTLCTEILCPNDL